MSTADEFQKYIPLTSVWQWKAMDLFDMYICSHAKLSPGTEALSMEN